MQGAQTLRNEAYAEVRRNDEGCSATQQMDFLGSRPVYSPIIFTNTLFFLLPSNSP